MDNATHALIGLLLAEAVILLAPGNSGPSARFFRGAARFGSLLANNVNDFDFLYAHRLGGKLGYILHHRGHTHTLLAGVGLGLGIYFSSLLVARVRRQTLSREQRFALLGLCVLGPCFHIGFDFLNNYGVHPFWPFDKRWFYGDTLFIIEPWLWVLLIPPLFFQAETRLGRAALGIVFMSGLVLAWALRMVPLALAGLLTAAGAGSVLFSLKASARGRLALAFAAAASVVLAFSVTSRLARAAVLQELDSGTGGGAQGSERLRDVVLTPSPGNPLCFSVVTLHLNADRYIARAGSLSIAEPLISTAGCRVQPTGLTLGLAPPTRPSSRRLSWEGEFTGSLLELGRLARSHCEVSAFLHFARVPFWRPDGVSRLLIGDVRFDRDPELDFDEFVVAEPATSCPPWVPDWRPPLDGLLEP